MKRLLIPFLLFASSAAAQSVRVQGVVQSRNGSPAPGAFVAVCTQPATIGNATTPCSPLATLATSTSTTSGGANPLQADGLGNYFFYAAPGRYSIQYYGSGLTTTLLPDQVVPADVSGPIVITGSLTVSGTTTTANLDGCQHVNAIQSYAAALAASGVPGCIVVDPGIYTVTANASPGSGIIHQFQSGGLLSIANGVTLTIGGPIIAPQAQIFAYVGTGTVVLGGVPSAFAVTAWFPGADLGAQIANADTAMGTNSGEQVLTKGVVSTTISTGPTIKNGHRLRDTQGLVMTAQAGITVEMGGSFLGVPGSVATCASTVGGTIIFKEFKGNLFTYNGGGSGGNGEQGGGGVENVTVCNDGITPTDSTFTIANSPTGATESGNIVTITTTATCDFGPYFAVTISGVGVAGYNSGGSNPATFRVLAPGCNGGSSFTYFNPTSGLGTSGGGTAAALGSGNALVITGTANNTNQSSFVKVRRFFSDGSDPTRRWTSCIYANGLPIGGAFGIRNIWISESRCTSSAVNNEDVRLDNNFNSLIGPQFLTSNSANGAQTIGITVSGNPGNISSNTRLLDVDTGNLVVDWASNTQVVGGNYTNMTATANVTGQNVWQPSFLGNAPTNNSPSSTQIIYRDQVLLGSVFNGGSLIRFVPTPGSNAYLDLGVGVASTPVGIRFFPPSTKFSWLLDAQNNVDNGFEITPSTAIGGSTFTTPVFQVTQGSGGKIAGGFTPFTAGSGDLGSAALPFGNLWLGAAATNNFKFSPGATTAQRIVQMLDPGANVNLGFNYNVTSGNYQSKRAVSGCTTAASIGGICASAVTITWPGSFPDTNYSAGCSPSGAPTNLPSTPYIVSKANGSMTVNYFAITAAAASWATLDCWATHD